ncbi:hypothetical protein GIF51_001775 [Neisseria gonorrhoeae]|uniref:hypothetical protein n=1 Tax=Neisseria gonorrhoeae TaxID=485 RepID=UPI002024FA52|nr:hypothetical protein [Neisseria gonorrhoeae]URK92424.1 hypothetical protein GYN05_05295 [Neisseria gonorrhoeae]
MPSEPSDGIFDRPPFTGAGRAWKYPNRHSRQYRNLETRPTTPQSRNPSDNTAISKPVRQHRNLETRHSRAGGNPDLSARKLIG